MFILVQILSDCRTEVCEALGIPEDQLELSMGMSGDFEQAVTNHQDPVKSMAWNKLFHGLTFVSADRNGQYQCEDRFYNIRSKGVPKEG